MKVVAINRKARHDYNVLDTYEAGIYAAESLLSLQIRKGTVIVMPRMNIQAVNKGVRMIDNSDLNHSFPGDSIGTVEEQIAWAITQMVGEERVNLVVSLHEAKGHYRLSKNGEYGQTAELVPYSFRYLPRRIANILRYML